VGYVSRPEPPLLPHRPSTRCLTANPDGPVLSVPTLDPETVALLGRAIIRSPS